jgi:hypothetical protein
MKTVSFKIKDSIFEETERILSRIKEPRNRYLNEALEYYNRFQKRLILGVKSKNEPDNAKTDSLTLLEDFDGIDYTK